MGAARYGKPFIPGEPEFNISHSGNTVVVAVNQKGAVGIDIEKIRAVNIEDFPCYIPEIAHLHKKHDTDHANRLFIDIERVNLMNGVI